RLGCQGHPAARGPGGAGGVLRAHPPQQPGGHGGAAAAVQARRERRNPRPDRARDLPRARHRRRAAAGKAARGDGERRRRRGEAVHRDRPRRQRHRRRLLPPRRGAQLRAAAADGAGVGGCLPGGRCPDRLSNTCAASPNAPPRPSGPRPAMRPAPRRWEVAAAAPLDRLPPVLGRVLAGRGFDSAGAAAWLGGSASFHDPFALAGMPEAVITLGVAMRERHRIAVYGDYDADGVTACAMLTRALRRSGADVLPYIPNRMTEGYGLHAAALEDLASRGADCVITVDCGTSSVEVAQGRPRGMRLVITDHHLPLAPDG